MKTCVLAVSITLAAAAGHAHAQLSSASIRQLNLLGTQTSTPNSGWGEFEFTYLGTDQPRFLNLQFNGQWVVQNAPLSHTLGIGAPHTMRVQFPLGATGPITGTWGADLLDAPSALYAPLSTQTEPIVAEDYQIGTIDSYDLGSLAPPPVLGFTPEQAVGATYYRVPGMDRYKNFAQARNHCAPGALASGMSWLKELGKVPENIPTTIPEWAEILGLGMGGIQGCPSQWYEFKREYFREHPEFGVSQYEIVYGAPGWEAALIEAITDRRLIELDLVGHVAVVAGFLDVIDGDDALLIWDDNQEDAGQSPWRLARIRNGAVGNQVVERFVVQIPAPASVPALGGVFALLAVRRRRTRA